MNISRTAPTEAGMGKGPFLQDEGSWSCSPGPPHEQIVSLVSCPDSLEDLQLAISSGCLIPFTSASLHTCLLFALFPQLYFILFPALSTYKSHFTSQEIEKPTGYFSLIFMPSPSAFPEAQPPILAHHPRKSFWVRKTKLTTAKGDDLLKQI